MKKSIFERFTPRIAMLAFAVLAICAMQLSSPVPAQAATTNYSPAVAQVEVIPIQISGQWTATTTSVSKFKLPFAAKLIGVSATARVSGGTTPTLTVNVKDDGTTVLSSAISITAGTVSEGTISAASIADESLITVDLTIGGTTPTWDDITVLLTVIRQ